jgi:hypothetical protein
MYKFAHNKKTFYVKTNILYIFIDIKMKNIQVQNNKEVLKVHSTRTSYICVLYNTVQN